MPPNTILLSAMMRELSARRPGFPETLLQQLGAGGNPNSKRGPALMTPDLIDELRKRILGRNWAGLDQFPGWTMREINPTVRLASHVAGGNPKLEAMSAVHPGASVPALTPQQARTYLDLGPYALDRSGTVSLDTPSTLPPFTTEGIVTRLSADLTRGDGPNALAAEHAESQRLADVMNRLGANGLAGSAPFTATLSGHTASTPQELVAALLATGHTVSVTDSRYFANFGHLHYGGQDVMMPFWVDTQIAVPGTRRLFRRPRPLLVPVSHAEYEWHIRAPAGKPGIDADVSHYFGIDGKAEWRTMDTLDQAWVLKRNAHTYTGPEAIEVTRLVGLVTVAYLHQHARRPALPFGGYYTLGVCQDPVSAIELKLTGHSTLFPNTADSSLFNDPRDPEVNTLMAAIPKDRSGAMPQPERVFGSLPAAPDADSHFRLVTIPGLPADLDLTLAAWKRGNLARMHGGLFYSARDTAFGIAALAAFAVISRLLLRRRT